MPLTRLTKKALSFLNGKSTTYFPIYARGRVEHYSYDRVKSIVRYIVYLETDYDTDGDGKPDYVERCLPYEVPKAAVNGDYKAATIFEALSNRNDRRAYLRGSGLKGWKLRYGQAL